MRLDQFPVLWNSLSSLLGLGFTPSVDPLPAPANARWASSGPVKVDVDSLTLDANCFENEFLSKALERAKSHITRDRWVPFGSDLDVGAVLKASENAPVISAVCVNIGDASADLELGVDESYELNVSYQGITIDAQTVWGALHALTTLEQVVIYPGQGTFVVEGPVEINDKPLYRHRGLMIDTARNFYSIDSLKRQVDALSSAKMNVFHWHLTDTQSWPIEVESYPEMTKDAYSPREVYTAKDVRELVQYAKERGVRVVPELDLPGHSNSGWRQVDSGIIACGDKPWEDVAVEPNPGQLEITNPNTYKVLKNVYEDISALFDDSSFHVGFDEVNLNCYLTSPAVRKWLKKNGDAHDLVQYWVNQTLPIFRNRPDRKLIMWQDSVLSKDISANNIPKDIALQSWVGGLEVIRDIISRGYEVIASSSEFVYLDCGFGGWVSNDPRYDEPDNPDPDTPNFNYGGDGGSWCGPYKSWQRIYSYNFAEGLSAQERDRVLGAEAALWSEQADGTVSDGIVWPRTAALGELLWSGNKDAKGNPRLQEMTSRILNFRERLVSRGINAQPLMPKFCANNRNACDFVYPPDRDRKLI